MQLAIEQIKPDPNQPRRTFDPDKMESLVASMATDGFRSEYPILVDGKHIIVDGERRWRAAKKANILQVPVVIKKDVTPYERLVYQLQSEGAELLPKDKYEAWVRLYDEGKKVGHGYADTASALGVKEGTFRQAVIDFKSFTAMVANLRKTAPGADTISYEENYGSLRQIGRVKDDSLRKQLAKKSVKEKWNREKTDTIKKAIDEKPYKADEILSHDYSGEHNWKMTLEVAKAGFSKKEAKELNEASKVRGEMETQVNAFLDIVTHGLKMAAAMRTFDYTQVTPQKRTELHQKLQKFVPFATGYISKLEAYMIEKGELKTNAKMLKE